MAVGAEHRRGPFKVGDRVQVTDERRRVHTLTLKEGGEFHTHVGVLFHDQLIGQPEGSVVENTEGVRYQALRPLLKDFVLSPIVTICPASFGYTTVAPRGIDNTKSFSNGRSA